MEQNNMSRNFPSRTQNLDRDNTWNNRCGYQHKLLNMQCVQNVYEFLDEVDQIRMQALNRRHYNQIIPAMLYELNCFGQRLISMSQRQLAIYNIPMRTQIFFNHPNLNDLSYSSFTVVQERVVITGGNDFADETQQVNGHGVYLIDLPKYSVQKKLKNYQQLQLTINKGANLIHPRVRHSSTSDGVRYVYVVGSQYTKANDKFEISFSQFKYQWREGPSLIKGGKNLSCCYFKSGQKEESIWVYTTGKMQRLALNGDYQVWTEIEINGGKLLQDSSRQAMAQISINQIIIFGGENNINYKDIDEVFYYNVEDSILQSGPKLPDKILPENPGYNLNSFASFYFLGNIGQIFKFNKYERSWQRLPFETGSVF